MNRKELLIRWRNAQIQPELFYAPVSLRQEQFCHRFHIYSYFYEYYDFDTDQFCGKGNPCFIEIALINITNKNVFFKRIHTQSGDSNFSIANIPYGKYQIKILRTFNGAVIDESHKIIININQKIQSEDILFKWSMINIEQLSDATSEKEVVIKTSPNDQNLCNFHANVQGSFKYIFYDFDEKTKLHNENTLTFLEQLYPSGAVYDRKNGELHERAYIFDNRYLSKNYKVENCTIPEYGICNIEEYTIFKYALIKKYIYEQWYLYGYSSVLNDNDIIEIKHPHEIPDYDTSEYISNIYHIECIHRIITTAEQTIIQDECINAETYNAYDFGFNNHYRFLNNNSFFSGLNAMFSPFVNMDNYNPSVINKEWFLYGRNATVLNVTASEDSFISVNTDINQELSSMDYYLSKYPDASITKEIVLYDLPSKINTNTQLYKKMYITQKCLKTIGKSFNLFARNSKYKFNDKFYTEIACPYVWNETQKIIKGFIGLTQEFCEDYLDFLE